MFTVGINPSQSLLPSDLGPYSFLCLQGTQCKQESKPVPGAEMRAAGFVCHCVEQDSEVFTSYDTRGWMECCFGLGDGG